ncbi:MAG: hypothetical protein ACUVQZ_07865 [Candidatus Caldatribacteriaceae bacterium]
MRIAFVYTNKDRSLVAITRFMVDLFEKAGCTVKAIEVENATTPVNFRPFDLVLVGSHVTSSWGGKISEEVTNFLRGMSGMEGKRSVAYIRPSLFGKDKALRRLMSHMESLGAFVVDFEIVGNENEARKLVDRHLKRG